jgi:antagonist of KipI
VDAIEMLDGGFFTTVQDLGRFGYQRYGVPVSGAMDLFALRAANLLAGNPESAAALEVTLAGPRIRFLRDMVVAVAGADLEPRLDDQPAPTWRPFAAPEGTVLGFGHARDGLRAYIALAGGIDVPVVLGSRSTFTRGELGGFDGRAIRAGDRLHVGQVDAIIHGRSIAKGDVPHYGHDHVVRVVLGPQADAFTPHGISTFLSSAYVVTPKSDRIGCRLEGPAVQHAHSADIVSDGNPFGAVQVAGDGLPMVLVADRGTTGGYTKLATVISADLPRLAQALPGDRVSFREIALAEAHRAVREQEAILYRIARSAPVVFTRKRLNVTVDGSLHQVTIGLVEQGRAAPVQATEGVTEVAGTARVSTMHYEIVEAGGPR